MKTKNLPRFSLPENIDEIVQWGLQQEKLSLNDTKILSESIIGLSQIYITKRPQPKIWSQSNYRAAYWSYFFPLNFLRLTAILQEAWNLGFLTDIAEVIDFGCGPGTGLLAWEATRPPSSTAPTSTMFFSIDAAQEPLTLLEKNLSLFPILTKHQTKQSKSLPSASQKNSLAMFSYSLNEGHQTLPKTLGTFSHIIILEPSSREQARRLMKWREELLLQGYFVWAPCTHQQACPLLTKSKSDWCHQRLLFNRPEWLIRLENNLPMSNRSLTFSYLLLSKKPPPDSLGARVIGDTLKEKGKIRQAICRGPGREFLTWLKKEKHTHSVIIPRGSRIVLPNDSQIKCNEIRLSSPINQSTFDFAKT